MRSHFSLSYPLPFSLLSSSFRLETPDTQPKMTLLQEIMELFRRWDRTKERVGGGEGAGRGRDERDMPNFLPDYLFPCARQLRGCEDAQSFLLN